MNRGQSIAGTFLKLSCCCFGPKVGFIGISLSWIFGSFSLFRTFKWWEGFAMLLDRPVLFFYKQVRSRVGRMLGQGMFYGEIPAD